MRSGMASPPTLAGVAASAAILLTNWSWIEASIVTMEAAALHNVTAAAKDVCGHAGAVDALRQFIHAPIS